MNLGAVLVTGLFAGGISCAAVQGGLLAGLVTRQRGLGPTTQPARPRGRAGAGTAVRTGTAARAGGGGTRRSAVATKASTSNAAAVRRRPGQPSRQQWRARTVEPPKPIHEVVLAALRSAPARLRAGWPSLRARAGDDLAPVGAFLGGKLVSHTLLGALLGALGAAVALSTTVRVWTQLGAGALIIAFGLAQLEVGPFKRLTITPPAAWVRIVRGRTRSQAAFAPAVLGFVTILVPCGVTLSVEALALTSGSAVSGAAVMAVFVLGTSPLFAALGYAARRAATSASVWRVRLAVATGLVVLGMGLYTLNGGLTLADSPLAARNLTQTFGFSAGPAVADPAVVHLTGDGRQEVIVTAQSRSYRPANIAVRAGIPTTLLVRSVDNGGCTRAFVIPSLRRQWSLPENGDTTIDLGVLRPGKLRYTCAMGMYTGQLTITDATSAERR